MPGAWEIRQQQSVLCGILHVDTTTVAWAFGLRNLIMPGSFMPVAGMPFDMARNVVCGKALELGAEWVFFLDSDVIPPRDAVLRLMSHRQPVVSGVYCRRSPPHGLPVMIKNGQWVTQFVSGSVIDVDVVGAGCLLIHRTVLGALPPLDERRGKRWFDWRVDMQHLLPPGEAMSEDFMFCFAPGTWVGGPTMRRIEDVEAGHVVFDHLGDKRRVLGVSRRPYAGSVVTINASYAGKISSTPGHKFFVVRDARGGGVRRQAAVGGSGGVSVGTELGEWVEARDIRAGDYLTIPKTPFPEHRVNEIEIAHYIDTRGMKVFPDGKWGYARTRKSALRINPRLTVSPGLCRLLGYYLAEGFPHAKEQAVNFAFGETHVDDVADCCELLKTIFGIEKLTIRTGGGCTTVTASSKILGQLFTALCGKGARNKHLPSFWSRLGRESLAELITGYWRGDGSYSGRSYSITTVSERLARETQAAISRLGILCGMTEKSNDYGAIYSLNIPAGMVQRFGGIVGHDCIETEARGDFGYYAETPDHFFVQVKCATESFYDGEVFNLKVATTETYTANGFGVHNCLQVRRELGVKILVDTSVQCRHVGLAQAGLGSFVPCETAAVT